MSLQSSPQLPGDPIPANFRGAARPRSPDILARIAAELGCEEAAARAVIEVEAAGSGFLPDGRPKILFERHKFRSFTEGRFAQAGPGISNRQPGGYIGGAAEYSRLTAAMAWDRDAALRSASWGLPQIMGFNFRLAGHDSVEAMVAAFCDGEDAHLLAFASFIRATGLADELRDRRWAELAAGYNGPGNVPAYARKLSAAYASAVSLVQHADNGQRQVVASAQAMLNLLGYGPLAVDGIAGRLTRYAVKRFQSDHRLPATGIADAATRAALMADAPTPPHRSTPET